MSATPRLPRDASTGYCLTAPLPFIVAPVVFGVRGAELWVVLIMGPVAGLMGMLIGSLFAFVVLEASRTVREGLGDVAISSAGTIAAFVFALLIPLR